MRHVVLFKTRRAAFHTLFRSPSLFHDATRDKNVSFNDASMVETYSLVAPSAQCAIDSLADVREFQKRVIYEDNHLLVVDKPVCLATQGAAPTEESLFTLAQHYIKVRYSKPGSVYLGVVSRLDFPVSGVVVFAKTSKSAGRLNVQFREHTVQKFYMALLEGKVHKSSGELIDYICEDKQSRRLWITDDPARSNRFTPKESRLKYRSLETKANTTLVEIELLTGRKHQIRLQFSHQQTPVVGDGKYGAQIQKRPGICLHACKLILEHPTIKRRMAFVSQHPDWSCFE